MADLDAAWTGGMPYPDFLNAVIDDGIESLRARYPDPHDERRTGGIAGFEACRDRDPGALLLLAAEAGAFARRRMAERGTDHLHWRWKALQVEWTLNVVNAARWANGLPVNGVPTGRGLEKAAEILGVGPGPVAP